MTNLPNDAGAVPVPAGASVQAVGHHAIQLGQPGLIGEHHTALLEYVPQPVEEGGNEGCAIPILVSAIPLSIARQQYRMPSIGSK